MSDLALCMSPLFSPSTFLLFVSLFAGAVQSTYGALPIVSYSPSGMRGTARGAYTAADGTPGSSQGGWSFWYALPCALFQDSSRFSFYSLRIRPPFGVNQGDFPISPCVLLQDSSRFAICPLNSGPFFAVNRGSFPISQQSRSFCLHGFPC